MKLCAIVCSPRKIFPFVLPADPAWKAVSEENRKMRWQFYREPYKAFSQVQPNPAHMAVAELEKMGKLRVVITQNIDNLHQMAGNSPEKVIEIHGTLGKVKCLSCGNLLDKDIITERLNKGEEAPHCDDCAGILKSATISFGEAMPAIEMERAQKRTPPKRAASFSAVPKPAETR